MRLRWIRHIAVAGLAVALVAGCGGGGGGPSGSDPTATVKDMIGTLTAGNWDKIPDYACAAKKDDIKKQFDPAGALGSGGNALGITAANAKELMKVTVADLKVTEKSRDGTKAIVAMSGKMKLEMNKDKFKEIMKKALEAAGQPADDATLNLAMGMLDSFSEPQDLDEEFDMVNEGGKWLICE